MRSIHERPAHTQVRAHWLSHHLIELQPLALRVYHGTYNAPVGLAPTSSVSVPAPRGHPSGAGFALHPPDPTTHGLRYARSEKICLLRQKVPSR